MTSQGTAHGRFTRAVRDRNLLTPRSPPARSAELSLPDALAFCLLLVQADPARFDRATARWYARLVLEAPGIRADEAALALLAAQGLAGLKTREISALTCHDSQQRMG
jgi:hypothetical protein